ncbi:hypothetical protein, partial [uncultured Pseudomonas sp.]|uniref:hypothetical protein n=1 Tax=uncultured Pseudomonas sp. TaxID=114707 RepID=UPI0025921FF0
MIQTDSYMSGANTTPVGAGLSGRCIAAMAVYRPIHLSTDTPPSQASQLPQGNAASHPGFAVAVALLLLCCCSAVDLLLIWLLILISGAPLNHAGRRQVLRSGHPGMDAGVAATRPWM